MTDRPNLPADVPEHTVWPIAGAHAATLDVVVAGLALVRAMVPREAAETGPIDLVADMFADTADIARSVRLLVRLFVRELATGPLDSAAAGERAAALGVLTRAGAGASPRLNRARRRTALDDAAEIVREMGLEYHDLDCFLGTNEDGTDLIVAIPVAPPVAHVFLIGRLFQRAEQFMSSDHALAVERAASAWYFARWSVGGIGPDEETTEFPRTVREQEWSLVSRDTLGLAEPVIASFVDDGDLFADDTDDPIDLPPRQRFLAGAFLRSTVGIFEVTDVDGRVMTVRDASTTASYRVYEHNSETTPIIGLVVLGRIIPLDDDLWLRSPGALVLSRLANVGELASDLEELSAALPTPIAVEALISTTVYGVAVPVTIRPAPTIAQAQAALAEVEDVLAEVGLLQDDVVDAGASNLPAVPEGAVLDAVGLGIDDAMAEWIAALVEQATLDSGRGKGGGSKATKKKSKKRAKRSRQRRRR